MQGLFNKFRNIRVFPIKSINADYNLLPLLPPALLVLSVGIGVQSSILPIFKSVLARALMADWAPGPGVLVSVPPLALNLMWTQLTPGPGAQSAIRALARTDLKIG